MKKTSKRSLFGLSLLGLFTILYSQASFAVTQVCGYGPFGPMNNTVRIITTQSNVERNFFDDHYEVLRGTILEIPPGPIIPPFIVNDAPMNLPNPHVTAWISGLTIEVYLRGEVKLTRNSPPVVNTDDADCIPTTLEP